MTELDKLIEAVEGGNLSEYHEPGQFKALPFKCWSRAASAYRGSLDAAKALHEALLPGWDASMHLYGKVDIYNDDDLPSIEGVCIDNPARAWLLSTLKAYRSTQG